MEITRSEMDERGIVNVAAMRDGEIWRCAIMPGMDWLAREILGEAAEPVIAAWTPEQIASAHSADLS